MPVAVADVQLENQDKQGRFWELLLQAGAEHDREIQACQPSRGAQQGMGTSFVYQPFLEEELPREPIAPVTESAESSAVHTARCLERRCLPGACSTTVGPMLKLDLPTQPWVSDTDEEDPLPQSPESSKVRRVSTTVSGSTVYHQKSSMGNSSVYSAFDEIDDNDDENPDKQENPDKPDRYELKRIWQSKVKSTTASRLRSLFMSRSAVDLLDEARGSSSTINVTCNKSNPWSLNSSSDDDAVEEDEKPWFMLHPSSLYRLVWDILGMLFVLYDFGAVPLAVFPLAETTYTIVTDWVTRMFWTLDMGFSFFVGYHEQGRVIFKFRRVVRHYLMTWFLLDLIIVGSDWTIYFIIQSERNSSADLANLGRSVRISRFMRTLRLLRLAKLKQMVKEVHDHIDSELVSTYLRVGAIMLLLMAINHVVACMWYGLSDWSANYHSKNWIQENGHVGKTVYYLYSTSLHWSLCQFTPASMDVHPHNTTERVFTIVVVLFAMIVFSSFVSQITTTTAHFWNRRSYANKQLWLLRKFLKKNSVSLDVSLRVQRYLEWVTELQMQCVREQDLEVLSMLSAPLRNELTLEVHADHLYHNDFFRSLTSKYSRKVYLKIWDRVISAMPLAVGDALFFSGETPQGMFCVAQGQLQYKRKHDMRLVKVGDGTWCCEGELWTHWVTAGDMRALTECQMVKIDCDRFAKNLRNIPEAFRHARFVGVQFVNDLNAFSAVEITDLQMIYHRAYGSFHKSGQRASLDKLMWSPRAGDALSTPETVYERGNSTWDMGAACKSWSVC